MFLSDITNHFFGDVITAFLHSQKLSINLYRLTLISAVVSMEIVAFFHQVEFRSEQGRCNQCGQAT